jgi:hypothetical protein
MSLNIKNKDAHKLAQRLARLTGESMTEAVTEAVRERLKRVQNKDKQLLPSSPTGCSKSAGTARRT